MYLSDGEMTGVFQKDKNQRQNGKKKKKWRASKITESIQMVDWKIA